MQREPRRRQAAWLFYVRLNGKPLQTGDRPLITPKPGSDLD